MTLICAWWRKHKIAGNITRLTKRIVPAAFDATIDRVDAFHAEQLARKQAKQAGKTNNRIRALLNDRGPSTQAEIAKALNISRHTVVVAVGRMTASGLLTHLPGGSYRENLPDTQDVTIHGFVTGQQEPIGTTPTPLVGVKPQNTQVVNIHSFVTALPMASIHTSGTSFTSTDTERPPVQQEIAA